MLNFTLTDNYAEMSTLAAKRVAQALERKPDLVMALPTGGTPIGLLQEMSRMARDNEADFSRAYSFNIDEYIPLTKDDPQSYYWFWKITFTSMPTCLLKTALCPMCWPPIWRLNAPAMNA